MPAFGIVKQSIRQQAMAECMKIAKGQKTIAGAMIAQNCGIAVWKILSCSACMCERELYDVPPEPQESDLLHSCLVNPHEL